METINGCTLIRSGREPEPVEFGPAEIGDAYRALVGRIPAGQPAPPVHRHPHTDEAFHVADGECTFQLGDREVVATGGDFVFVPRGTTHTAWNSSERELVGLIVISPGGAEHVFELVAPA